MKTALMNGLRPSTLALLIAASGPICSSSPATADSRSADGRVIILGFDGADSRTTSRMIAADELPNLKRLAEQGSFEPLISTNPAESAAGWAALNTGLNPAKNGIPSFFGRSPEETPIAIAYHLANEARSTESMEMDGLLGVLSQRSRVANAGILGLVLCALCLAIVGGLFRVRLRIAGLVALVSGGAAGYGVWTLADYLPKDVPHVFVNKVEADGFWKPAAEAGKPVVALFVPMSWDRPATENVRLLSGLGLPDVRPDIGEYFIYTTDDQVLGAWPVGQQTVSTTGNSFHVIEEDGVMRSKIAGPINFWEADKLRAQLVPLWEKKRNKSETDEEIAERKHLAAQLTEYYAGEEHRRTSVDLLIERKGQDKVTVTLDGQSQDLAEGEWSDWYSLEFKLNPLLSSKAITRAKLLKLGAPGSQEPFRLLINMLNSDPRDPAFWQPISQPADFAEELVAASGDLFETIGWACMTNPMKDKMFDIATFLEGIEFTMSARERVTRTALERGDWSVLFSVFSVTDRVQHIMYKYHDPQHPKHDPVQAAREVTFFGEQVALRDIIPAIYRQMDRIVGWVLDDFVRQEDTLLLCADHGFTSFRRGVHVNNWLAEKGYLTIKRGVRAKKRLSALELTTDIIDWNRTSAYSLGLGMVFINQRGREPHGVIRKAAARDLLENIRQDFLDTYDVLRDGSRVKVGADAVILADIYEGPFLDRCADLQLGFAEHYRVSWATAAGKIILRKNERGAYTLGESFETNRSNWSGDHASNSPHVVTGIFFCNKPIVVPEDGVSVLHIAPTVLDLVGAPIPDEYDREPLSFK